MRGLKATRHPGLFKLKGIYWGRIQGQFMKAIWRTGGFRFGLLAEGWSELMLYRPIG